MKRSVYLFVALAIIACGAEKPNTVDAQVQAYVDNFLAKHPKAYVPSISFVASLGNTRDGYGVAGRCEGGKIQLSEYFWPYLKDAQREIMVWHEMGHCSLSLGHNEARDVEGCPTTFMSAVNPSEYCSKKLLSFL